MPQFSRPEADLNNPGLWTTQAGGSTNLWDTVNEVTPDDADYAQSPLAPVAAVLVFDLSSVTDPVSSSGHIFRTRYFKDVAGGAQIDLISQLRQTYVSEASQGTLIVARTFTNITDTPTTDAYTLSGAEADAITNYGLLAGRLSANQI